MVTTRSKPRKTASKTRKTAPKKTTRKTSGKKTAARKSTKMTIPQKTIMCANKAPFKLEHGIVAGYLLQPDTSKTIRRCIKSTGSRKQVWDGDRAFTRTRNGFKLIRNADGEIKRGKYGVVPSTGWEQGGLSKSNLFRDSRTGAIKSKRASQQAKKQYTAQRKKNPEFAQSWNAYTIPKSGKTSVYQKRQACQKQGKVLNPKTGRCRKSRR